MNLRNFANKTVDFITDRLKELIGLTLSIISVLIAISLFSYSPEDPNFIYSENISERRKKLEEILNTYVLDNFNNKTIQ